ncbi:RNA polymerase sigma factor [Cyclobacterium salsum]|uniref:RNA polymerase sigma factor n=1 Tax=Cyclobacterium salsum TaxID=2666329 RepID=UPI001390E52F|nr:sigma-70 family RNA polymerase sigma factor [Cyclobacterium salsum]
MNSPDNKKFNSENQQENDSVLWIEFKRGNPLAFSTLYDCYVDDLYRYGCSFTKDRQMVEDAIQDIFIYLWNNRKNTTDLVNVKYYLIKVLRNDLIKKIKKNSVQSIALADQKVAILEQRNFSYEHELFSQQQEESMERRIRQLVNLLNGRQREVLYLRFFQEMSYEQIASILEIDIKYTYNIFSKAINQLKKHLAEGFDLFADQ